MIHIVTEPYDTSTDKVMDYLWSLNIDVKRIDSSELFLENSALDLSAESPEIKGLWFRKNSNNHLGHIYQLSTTLSEDYDTNIYWVLENEYLTAKQGYFSYLKHNAEKILGDPTANQINKIDALLKAKETGFDIPSTILCNNKGDLQRFFQEQDQNIITKGIDSSLRVSHKRLASYTEKLSEDQINNLSDSFYVSKFQANVEKQVEIRVFYLDGESYAMAIFSQNDDQTKVDFRRYNTKKGNRNIPFMLGEEEKEKVQTLMSKLNLNTGSLDFILTEDNKLIFLEVNPTGQYGMVSFPCNYDLDSKISNYLANN